MSDARSPVNQLEALTKLLVGATTVAETALALGTTTDEVRRLTHAVGADSATLVPVAIDVERRRVELRDLRGLSLHDPFFADALERARQEDPEAVDVEVDLETFVAAAASRRREPDGFVFHVGRCGSTLLANMLTASGAHLVVKEPNAVNDAIAAVLSARNDDSRQRAESILAPLIRYLLWSLPAPGGVRYRVVKFAAWNVQLAPTILDLFPQTGAVFLFRSPLETVASMLFQRPGWFDLIHLPHEIRARFFPTLGAASSNSRPSPAELFAHAWTSAAEAALVLPNDRLATVDYQELVRSPEATISRVLSWLGHTVEQERVLTLAAATAIYAKDPTGRARFDPKGEHRRPSLAPEDAEAVRAVTSNAWERLRERAGAFSSASRVARATQPPSDPALPGSARTSRY